MGNPPTILLMDNDAMARMALTTILSKALPDCTMLPAVSQGADAIRICTDTAQPPSILLADVSMNDINGPLVARAIRKTNDSTVILALTASVLAVSMAALGRLLTRGRYLAADRRRQAADEHAELVRLKHGNQLAIAIHDTLSNDLTFVSSVARDRLQAASPDAQAWRSVLDRSQKAFEQVHDIIAYLNDPQHSSLPEPPFMEDVRRRLTEVHDQLAAMGYGGTCDCEGLFLGHAPEVQREVCSLLTELGTNIRRHASKSDDAYLISIVLSEQYVEIRETNDIAPDALTAAERSGRGLDMHRTRIGELGGVLNTNSEEGVWTLYARIPWEPTEA